MNITPLQIKLAIVGMSILFAGLLAWGLFRSHENSLGTIQLYVAPSEVTAVINDNQEKVVTNEQALRLKEGFYTIRFTKDSFKDNVQHVTVEAGESIDLAVFLTPEDDSRQLSDFSTAERHIIQAAQSHLITKLLPMTSTYYSLNNCPSLKAPGFRAVCLMSNTEGGKELALSQLTEYELDRNYTETYMGTSHGYEVLSLPEGRLMYYPSDHMQKQSLYFYADNLDNPEDTRNQLLASLKEKGYLPESLTITYTDSALMKYNPVAHEEEDHDHATVPMR